MFAVNDKIVIVATGEIGVVTESFGLDCYMVLLEGWDEPCQVHGRMLCHRKDYSNEDGCNVG